MDQLYLEFALCGTFTLELFQTKTPITFFLLRASIFYLFRAAINQQVHIIYTNLRFSFSSEANCDN